MSLVDRTADDKFLDYDAAAQLLQTIGIEVSRHTVRRWANAKKLPFIKPFGKKPLIAESALRRWCEQRQREAEREVQQTGAKGGRRK